MTITVGDLLRTPALSLRLVVGTEDLEVPVAWAHVSELADPTPYLEGGELILTTGPWMHQGIKAVDYVGRLKAANVVGIAFGAGVAHGDVPHELVRSAQKFQLPLMEVPPQTPFIAISKAVSRALAAEELGAVTSAYEAQRALTSAAAKPDGTGAVMRALHRILGGWVLLVDEHGTAIEAVPSSVADRLPEFRAELANVRRRSASTAMLSGPDESILIYALHAATRPRAFLLAGAPTPPSPTNRQVINTAAALLTLTLERRETFDDILEHLEARVLTLLRTGAVGLAADLLSDLGRQMPPTPCVHALVMGDAQSLDHLRAVMATACSEGSEIVLQARRRDVVELLLVANGVVDQLLRALPSRFPGLRAGLAAASDSGSTACSYAQAREALERSAPRRPLVDYRDVGATGFLELLPPQAGAQHARALLGPLMAAESTRRHELLRTLRAWLEHHGQWDSTAAALQVHRHTAHGRIDKIQELLGQDLTSAAVRMELWTALEVLQEGHLTDTTS